MAPSRTEIDPELRKRLFEHGDLPSQTEFVSELISLAGGPRALARKIWAEFNREGVSPMLRTRVFEILLRSLKAIGDTTAANDPSGMTDEELEAFVADRLGKLQEAKSAEPKA